MCIAAGLVLGSLYVGGYLMSQNEFTAGDLMSFMVATQTIQRCVLLLFQFCFIIFIVALIFFLCHVYNALFATNAEQKQFCKENKKRQTGTERKLNSYSSLVCY